MFHRRNPFVGAVLAVLCAGPALLEAGVILDPSAPNGLVLFRLGSVPDVAAQYSNEVSYEGLAISGNTMLLSVGNAATANQTVWALPLVRSNNHIVGFGGATAFAQVLSYPADHPELFFGNIMAGGLAFRDGGLIYTTFSNSFLGQSTGTPPATLLDLAGTGVVTGGLNAVPASFTGNGAGQLKISSSCEPGASGCAASGDWYTLNLTGSLGSYALSSFIQFNVGVPAFSFDYVPADATFTHRGLALGDAIHQRLDFYQVDADGNPCNPAQNVACAQVIHLVTGDVQVGLGTVRDPLTGDLLFTTGANDVWLLSDTIPEPSSVALALGGIALVAALKWFRN